MKSKNYIRINKSKVFKLSSPESNNNHKRMFIKSPIDKEKDKL